MSYGGLFDPESKNKQIKELEQQINQPNFWDNQRESEKIISSLNTLKKVVEQTAHLKERVESNLEILKELKENLDQDLFELIAQEFENLSIDVDQLEVEVLLSGQYDSLNAILEIHSGAGGTEACDWANMLYRMYMRWCEKKGYQTELMDLQNGDEAGIKSISVIVKGIHAYGYLKNEKGVHRLVRLSPFDSNNRRHTSFASVEVTPLFENTDIDIDMNSSDLRIDVYRSSGCGGQGVNTTDSAVRITHIPTKIVVTCQNERSQIQNKERAMEVLKNKLYQLELEKRDQDLKKIKGTTMDINFGSAMRSYIMHPYSLVKDNRTGTETSNVSKVLDGDIDLFIHNQLKKGE